MSLFQTNIAITIKIIVTALPFKNDKRRILRRLSSYNSNSKDILIFTHLDFSARVQTVHKETNSKYWDLIKAFKDITDYGLVINTSFNVRGEPIVCTPYDAYRCFMSTEMDFLVMENVLLDKRDQIIGKI